MRTLKDQQEELAEKNMNTKAQLSPLRQKVKTVRLPNRRGKREREREMAKLGMAKISEMIQKTRMELIYPNSRSYTKFKACIRE